MPADAAFVVEVLRRLERAGLDCLLFGGWAEEAFGLCPPRPHADIDLLWRTDSLERLDQILDAARPDFTEIAAKRFAHKRAFNLHGVMVEITQVRLEHGAPVTWFWGDVRYEWLQPLAERCRLAQVPVLAASSANLQRYRRLHRTTEPWRWREPDARPGPRSLSRPA